jgi:hypothetical protein
MNIETVMILILQIVLNILLMLMNNLIKYLTTTFQIFIPFSIIELKFSNKFSKHIKPLHVVEGLIMDSKNGIKMTVYIKPMVIECLSDGNDAQEDFEVKMKDYKAGLLKKILDKKKY